MGQRGMNKAPAAKGPFGPITGVIRGIHPPEEYNFARSSRVFICGYPFAYLLWGTHRKARRTQCNNHLHINELHLSNVSHIKY